MFNTKKKTLPGQMEASNSYNNENIRERNETLPGHAYPRKQSICTVRDRLPGGSDEVRVVRRENTEQPLRERERERERELEGGDTSFQNQNQKKELLISKRERERERERRPRNSVIRASGFAGSDFCI